MALLLKGDQNCVSEMPVEKEAVQTEISFDAGTEKKVEEPIETKKEQGEKVGKKVKNLWGRIASMLMDDDV